MIKDLEGGNGACGYYLRTLMITDPFPSHFPQGEPVGNRQIIPPLLAAAG